MSIETIGKELLPNVYIKSVNVYDHSSLLNSVDITVCVLDFEDENGDLFWSSKDLLLKNMKILFVTSEANEVINGLTDGTLLMNKSSIKKSFYYDVETTKLKIKNVTPTKTFVRDNIHYFEHKVSFKFKKSSSNVSFFCATTLDARKLSIEYSLDLFDFGQELITGPISSEKIVSPSSTRLHTQVE